MNSEATKGSPSGYAKSISLPEVFRNLNTAKIFAVDIGELQKPMYWTMWLFIYSAI